MMVSSFVYHSHSIRSNLQRGGGNTHGQWRGGGRGLGEVQAAHREALNSKISVQIAGLCRPCLALATVPITTSVASRPRFVQPTGLPAGWGSSRRRTSAWQNLDLQTAAVASSECSRRYSAGTNVYTDLRSGLVWHSLEAKATHGPHAFGPRSPIPKVPVARKKGTIPTTFQLLGTAAGGGC
jgi:hypothetical protein